MKPQTALAQVNRALKRIGKTGDQTDLDAYLNSEQFDRAARVMRGEQFKSMSVALVGARQEIERRLPLLPPGPHRAKWDDHMIQRLRNAWRRHRGNAWRVARELRITQNAAETAYKRFVATTPPPAPGAARSVPDSDPFPAANP